MNTEDRIVVGLDGSEPARRALAWALREAARTNASVEAITVWDWDGIEGSLVSATSPAEEEQRAEDVLAAEIRAAAPDQPPTLTGRTRRGRASTVLTKAAVDARMLVLGSHGFSRLHHAVLGSVAEECVRAATCPVMVIPAGMPG
ncbi:MAG TPA: universal stress protein [Stackebrandtia sp.]|jgi:nucleotide-binding universal stress UspA family protein|uniref:universal stress protein n=1 Tax=Stackebrandtia sp. TaxID=2023065 RepID=UPI002D5A310B|nr:universal stress protein [Stackebrandtia sp.]HZE38338.1 universal stress protein [Stackebrandtia sp.]